MVFILGPDVNPGQVPSHISGGLVRVTRVTNFFILQICKNNIILVKKIQWVLRRVLKKIKKNLKKIWILILLIKVFISWMLIFFY
jgi:hypothetical protein